MGTPKWVQNREKYKNGLFAPLEGIPFGLQEAIDLSLESLKVYGKQYPHWAITYSGGKDSSALVSFIIWAIESRAVSAPQSLTVIYADTLMELPPLATTAETVLADIEQMGYSAIRVIPALEKRFWANILGRGVIPPKRNVRWCTRQLKKDPMDLGLPQVWEKHGQDNVLILTGVRMGESADRDQRITTSCSTSDGECGQGWFQQNRHALAPLLHWRVCWIWKWLYGNNNPLPSTLGIEPVYKVDDVFDIRTGCISCNLINIDWALKTLIKVPEWSHLAPLLRLKDMYQRMYQAKHRVRYKPQKRKDGTYSAKRVNNLGALTIKARKYFYGEVQNIAAEARYPLISDKEDQFIHWCWINNVWPKSAERRYKPSDPPPKALIIQDGLIVGEQLPLF